MHQIFVIDDIVRMIAQYLALQDLDCLGRLHPTFQELALDRRWQYLDGFDSVIHLLPKTETDQLTRKGMKVITLASDGRDTALNILRRVRRLEYIYSDVSNSETHQVLYSWAKGLSDGCLLPALRSLTLIFAKPPEKHCLATLLGPALDSLSITKLLYGTHGRERSPFIVVSHLLRKHCKHLTSLSLSLMHDARFASSKEADAITAAIKHLHHLKSFRSNGLSLGDHPVIKLARTPHLKELQLSHLPDHPSAFWITSTSKDVFSSLTALTIVCSEISSLVALLKVVASVRFERLNVTATGSSDQPIRALCQLVASRWPNMASFSIELSLQDRADLIISISHFRPLLECRLLRDVGMSGTTRLVLSDEDVLNMVLAWPRLQSMFFIEGVPGLPTRTLSRSPTLTQASLRTIASHCPDLHSLGLSVDFDAPYSVVEEDPPSLPSRLQNFHLSLSTMTEPNSASRTSDFLRQLFPFLCTLDYTRKADWLPASSTEARAENARQTQRVRAVHALNGLLGTHIQDINRRRSWAGEERYGDGAPDERLRHAARLNPRVIA